LNDKQKTIEERAAAEEDKRRDANTVPSPKIIIMILKKCPEKYNSSITHLHRRRGT
jgi:hypothetical protein